MFLLFFSWKFIVKYQPEFLELILNTHLYIYFFLYFRQNVLQEGKLEKSMITFAINHPRWQTDPLQTDLLTSIAKPTDLEQEQSFINLQKRYKHILSISEILCKSMKL